MESVRSVERAIKILKAINTKKNGLTVSEIAAKVDLHTTTVIRILATLESEDFVVRDLDTLAYGLGNSFIEMGTNYLKNDSIYDAAYQEMQKLVERFEETVVIYVIKGTKRVCIEKIEGLHPIRWHIEIGDAAPLGISGSGKLLLAFASQSLVDSVLQKQLVLRDGTIVDPEELKKELARIRIQGYASSFSENSLDGAGISAPIRNQLGRVIASLTILGPMSRLNKEKVNSFKDDLIASAMRISFNLGYTQNTIPSRGNAI